jgi:hypothetical protein
MVGATPTKMQVIREALAACYDEVPPRHSKELVFVKDPAIRDSLLIDLEAVRYDLRHTGCTRMLEAGVAFPVLAMTMGRSLATTVRMANRYGHIGQKALITAVETISPTAKPVPPTPAPSVENPAGSFDLNVEVGTNVPKIEKNWLPERYTDPNTRLEKFGGVTFSLMLTSVDRMESR